MIDHCVVCKSSNIKIVYISLNYLKKVVEGVPAIGCLDCGEIAVFSETMERYEELVKEGKNTFD